MCQNAHLLFLCTKPRLSQAGALLLPKDFVSLSITFYTMTKIHFRPYNPNQTVLFPPRIDEDIAVQSVCRKRKRRRREEIGRTVRNCAARFFCLYDTAFFNRNERAAACGIRECVRRCYGQCSALFYGNIAVVPVFRHLQCGGCDI